MKSSVFSIFGIFLFFLSFSLSAEGEIRDNSTGVVFPSEISIEQEGKQFNLKVTGLATRKKFFVKVYTVASYVQEGTVGKSADAFQQIIETDAAKQLTMKWVHEASATKVQDGYWESFKNALSQAQFNQLQNEISTFIGFFKQNVKKGDEHILRSFPGGYVEVIINGNKVGDLTNPEFAKGLWSIWFGPKSVVDRNKLVSMMF